MRFILLLLLCTAALHTFAAAEEAQLDEILDALPAEARQQAEKSTTPADGGKNLLNYARTLVAPAVESSMKSAVGILITVIAVGIVSAPAYRTGKAALLCGILAVSALTFAETEGLITLGISTLERLDTFSKALLPTVVAAAASCGNVTAGGALAAASMLFSDILLTAVDRLFLPLIYGYMAACIGAAAVEGSGLDSVAKLIKTVITLGLSVFLTAFTLYTSLTKAFAGSADAALVKTAKLAMSTFVPVVGGIISDGAQAVMAGALTVKNTLGLVGVTGILAVSILPFVKVGVCYLLYRITACLCTGLCDPRLSGLLEGLSAAYAMVLGLVGANCYLLLLSVVSAVRLTVL